MDLSIIIPCYCSGNNIVKVVEEIDNTMKSTSLSYEIIMVNDGSPDNTFEIIADITKKYKNTYAVDLAKNCGQHSAIMAGFNYAKGEYISTCEDDGQADVTVIPALIGKLKEGYDVAAPIYKQRGERSLFRKLGTKCATAMGKWMIPRPHGIMVPIFFAAKRFVIKEIIKYNQPFPYIEGLILRSTYNIALVEAEQKERIEGKSGYNFKKLFALWLNGFTSFSIKPLRLSSFVGIICAFIGFLFGVITVIRKLINPSIVAGYSSTISILLFIGGLIMLMLGVIGEYVGRIYLCINQTPQFVVRQTTYKNNKNCRNGEDLFEINH